MDYVWFRASNKVHFQCATLSLERERQREREAISDSPCKKVSAKSAGIVGQIVRRPTRLCCRVLSTVWLFFFCNLGHIHTADNK